MYFILHERLLWQFAQHNYQTRCATDRRCMLPNAKSSMLQKTVMYRAMVIWNSLPMHIVQESIKEQFKSLLKQHLQITLEQLCLCVNCKKIIYGLG